MTNPNEGQDLIGKTAVDVDGAKIGKIGQVYLDDHTQQPVWVTVQTGLFGNKETFAPLYGAKTDGDQLVLGVSKALVKDAPNMDADGHLEDSENDRLYQHYSEYFGTNGQIETSNGQTGTSNGNVAYNDAQYTGERSADSADVQGQVGYDTSGPTTDEAMTRSEERLQVVTEQVEAGRARLRKYIVTENVTTTVPVSHEEVRIEREPITEANRDAALSGGDITEEEHEVVLHAEQPVVAKETVPVERVRLATETVTEQHEVTEQVRKEVIDEQPEVVTDARTTTDSNAR